MKIRKLSLVTIKKDWVCDIVKQAPFFSDLPLVYLGEIPNMRGHGVFIGFKSGKTYSGFHIDQFRELTEDET
jgi:hypothetical protein